MGRSPVQVRKRKIKEKIMFAIVKDGAITKTGPSLRGLFPNVSFPASGPDNDWKTTEGVKEIVEGVQKDQK